MIPSTFEENLDKSKYTPLEYVIENAKLKALDVYESECKKNEDAPADLVIGSDTVVVFDEKILEKPKDSNHAKQMLSSLSGQTHTVASGVALINKNKDIHTFVQTTKVTFGTISSAMIESYIETKESFDKAGGYGMQAIGGQFVEKIDGCYFNVVGFPLQLFCSELRSFLHLDDIKADDDKNEAENEPPAKKQKT